MKTEISSTNTYLKLYKYYCHDISTKYRFISLFVGMCTYDIRYIFLTLNINNQQITYKNHI